MDMRGNIPRRKARLSKLEIQRLREQRQDAIARRRTIEQERALDLNRIDHTVIDVLAEETED
jgi:hypothetical protein